MAMAGRGTTAGRSSATGVADPALLALRTNCVSRWLCRATGSMDGAVERLVLDRARGIGHAAYAAWRRATAREYARRRGAPTSPASARDGVPTGTIAERSAAGRHAGRAVGSRVGAVGVNCPKEGRTRRTHTSQVAGIAQVAPRRKKAVFFARLPVDTGVFAALPLSMRQRGGGNDMARRRLLICRPAQRTRSRPDSCAVGHAD
jgi:hypothetical protein